MILKTENQGDLLSPIFFWN